ncbi:hypothetical protein RJ55_04432 [Drechmeria coniospora]|nr:hypothetical protein RJ55_04432 [Drechmeria coniospora]
MEGHRWRLAPTIQIPASSGFLGRSLEDRLSLNGPHPPTALSTGASAHLQYLVADKTSVLAGQQAAAAAVAAAAAAAAAEAAAAAAAATLIASNAHSFPPCFHHRSLIFYLANQTFRRRLTRS